ncbi:MAG: hypothetical protein XD80_0921, partial [Synergistales bacterium 53_16]
RHPLAANGDHHIFALSRIQKTPCRQDRYMGLGTRRSSGIWLPEHPDELGSHNRKGRTRHFVGYLSRGSHDHTCHRGNAADRGLALADSGHRGAALRRFRALPSRHARSSRLSHKRAGALYVPENRRDLRRSFRRFGFFHIFVRPLRCDPERFRSRAVFHRPGLSPDGQKPRRTGEGRHRLERAYGKRLGKLRG